MRVLIETDGTIFLVRSDGARQPWAPGVHPHGVAHCLSVVRR